MNLRWLWNGNPPKKAAGNPAEPKVRLPSQARTWLAAAGLWTFVVLGAFGGISSLFSHPSARAAAGPVPASSVAPAGWAQLFVQAYLPAGQGDTAGLAPFLAQVPDLDDVTAGRVTAASTTTIDAYQTGPGYWAVEVAAQVEELESGQWTPLGVRFYQVGVFTRGGRFVATSLPEQVPGPTTTPAPQVANVNNAPPNPDDPRAATVSQFLNALLAGQGQVGRYVPAGSVLRAVTPAPFASVTVTTLSTPLTVTAKPGVPVTVSAQVEGTDRSGQVQQLAYQLRLTEIAGQWEVSDLVPAAPLAAPTTSSSIRP